jgi:histidine triad (HIT) family protein
MSDCVFCDIIRGDATPGGREIGVFRFARNVAFQPISPVVEGHLLIVPMQHVTDDPKALGDAMATAATIASGAYKAWNLIVSHGRPATQTIEHMHVHLVPRRHSDGLFLPWSHPDTIRKHLASNPRYKEDE